MKLANLAGRAALVLDGDRTLDIATASGGRFGPDPMDCYERWDDLVAWAATVPAEVDGIEPLDPSQLANPAPRPRQVFAIGLNYRKHAEESGMPIPEVPATFTKFPASLGGPFDDVEIHGDTVD